MSITAGSPNRFGSAFLRTAGESVRVDNARKLKMQARIAAALFVALPVLGGRLAHAEEAAQAEAPLGRDALVEMVRKEAAARGLPPAVAEAVAQIESGYDPAVVGGVGEIGLMQIRPATAAMLGHSGGAAGLFDPSTNVRFAVGYLAGAWKLAAGDLCRALMKYRAGHNSERMSALSVDYCRRAKTYLAKIGSPLADAPLPEPEFGSVATAAPARGRGRSWTAADSARFWEAHDARIKAMTARILKVRAARIEAFNARVAKRQLATQ
jgi:soluble lytic murein transglycosylase-like protein